MNRAEQQPHREQNHEPSIKELQASLIGNGWETLTKEVGEHDKRVILRRSYNANNTLLQEDSWFDAVVQFYEREDISPEHTRLLSGQCSTENERNVFLQIDVNDRSHLMHALDLDQWLRDWGFEDRDESARQMGLSV